MKSGKYLKGDEIERKPADPNVVKQILGYDQSVMMVKVDFAEGSEGALHSHPHSQTSYIISGRFGVAIDDEYSVLSAGDGFYVEPDKTHGVLCLEEGSILDCFSPVRADFLK